MNVMWQQLLSTKSIRIREIMEKLERFLEKKYRTKSVHLTRGIINMMKIMMQIRTNYDNRLKDW